MAAQYGWALSVLDSQPELKRMFDRAVKETWTGPRFVAELRNTKWFRRTSAEAREWFILTKADPAEAKRRTNARAGDLGNLAQQLGVDLSDKTLRTVATQSLLMGWDDQQTRRKLARRWNYVPGESTGLAATTIAQLRDVAGDYLLPLSNHTIERWTRNVLDTDRSVEDFQAYAQEQAKSLFPHLAKSIDAGVTVSQYVEPYRQLASQTLEIAPESVNFRHGRWRKAIDQVGEGGQRNVMSLTDWETLLKKNPVYGYDRTEQARSEASQLVTGLSQMFGVTG
jgi:hypothetical protein